jgi:hypothetical protein
MTFKQALEKQDLKYWLKSHFTFNTEEISSQTTGEGNLKKNNIWKYKIKQTVKKVDLSPN